MMIKHAENTNKCSMVVLSGTSAGESQAMASAVIASI